eukprot:CAMPEP_0197880306 /NCGR_PEP_ID=MMETSP1439-20131203/8162_1 /TAXON_ID=66791 /ORGANISM="Gonyaulax spinifera, Strain CCMP409" /LENGTH=340 /DNA_ID=CAMNT_0043499859 /DNA_START=86 /DNA_END=1108 /DNA_ORIENTATION=+
MAHLSAIAEGAEADSFPMLAREIANLGEPPRRVTLRRKLLFGGLAVGALAAACLVLTPAQPSLRRATRAQDLRPEQKVGLLDLANTFADGVTQSAEAIKQVRSSWKSLNDMANLYNESAGDLVDQKDALIKAIKHPLVARAMLLERMKSLNATQKAALKAHLEEKFNITNGELNHFVHMHDGNPCEDDEELYSGLCYKKCSLLTGGTSILRTSAWSCCKQAAVLKCLGEEQKTDVEICAGYGVSGDSTGNGCPHAPGGCLRNEEFFLGICYKMCSFLTYDKLPFRCGPDTCCKTSSWLSFLDLENCDTNARYGVGGGVGDHNKITPAIMHLPLSALTEAQ